MEDLKQISARDKKVQVRNSILTLITKGCYELNNGSHGQLANTLKCIHNETNGIFSVDTKPEGTYEFFHTNYRASDGIILIKEGDKELIMVLKLKEGKCKGEWRAYELDYYEFRYDTDLEAEAEWERDSESAYERYLDSKTIYDDPRGY